MEEKNKYGEPVRVTWAWDNPEAGVICYYINHGKGQDDLAAARFCQMIESRVNALAGYNPEAVKRVIEAASTILIHNGIVMPDRVRETLRAALADLKEDK